MSFARRDRLHGMQLYYHPRSPYSHKVLIAFTEKRVAFDPVSVKPGDERLATLTPIRKVPLLVLDDGWKIPESTIIVEYLDTHFTTGPRLIPEDRDQARQTRFHDRIADLYVTEPLMALQFERGDAAAAHAQLDAMFTGIDRHLGNRTWISGDAFSLADCAIIPALRYARRLHPFERYTHLTAYFARAVERSSVKRVFDEAVAYEQQQASTSTPAAPTAARWQAGS